jgi:hypothetical protein
LPKSFIAAAVARQKKLKLSRRRLAVSECSTSAQNSSSLAHLIFQFSSSVYEWVKSESIQNKERYAANKLIKYLLLDEFSFREKRVIFL